MLTSSFLSHRHNVAMALLSAMERLTTQNSGALSPSIATTKAETTSALQTRDRMRPVESQNHVVDMLLDMTIFLLDPTPTVTKTWASASASVKLRSLVSYVVLRNI